MPEEKHGDAAAHDVKLAALVADERQRVLGAIGDAVAVQGVNPPCRPPLAGRVLPGITLVARRCRLSSVTLTHLAPTQNLLPNPRKLRQTQPEKPKPKQSTILLNCPKKAPKIRTVHQQLFSSAYSKRKPLTNSLLSWDTPPHAIGIWFGEWYQ